MLASRIERVTRARGADTGRRVASADRSAPFVLAAMRAEAPPAEADKPMQQRGATEQERIELSALAANGGNPVIDAKTLERVRNAR